jgi:hypothetical protein
MALLKRRRKRFSDYEFARLENEFALCFVGVAAIFTRHYIDWKVTELNRVNSH